MKLMTRAIANRNDSIKNKYWTEALWCRNLDRNAHRQPVAAARIVFVSRLAMDKKPVQSAGPVPGRPIHIEPMYDSHEVASQCKVSEKSLQRWARSGKIPAVKLGKLWRFRKSAIDEWMNRRMAS